MFNTQTELFFNTYFTFEGIAGKLVGSDEFLFNRLFDVFLLPSASRQELWGLVSQREVCDIETYIDFAQYCRIQKYSQLVEGEEPTDGKLQDVITIKGGALRTIALLKINEFSEATESSVCKIITDTANKGLIPSLCALGFLQCEGLFVERDVKHGIENLDRAARWNSPEGILLALYYDEQHREKNVNRLFTAVDGTPYEDLIALAQRAYDLSKPKLLHENKLLRKAFGAGILKPEVYISQYSRFLFSDILLPKDKERTIYSVQKGMISETAELPLKLKYGDISFNGSAFFQSPVRREEEQKKICAALANSDLRRYSTHRPLCICADSDYLVALYAKTVERGFAGTHVERIDVADLGDYDFDLSKNNVFVRSCEEKLGNVYFLFFRGDIPDRVFETAKNFLSSEKRAKFRLARPALELDLRAILPVCFCDRANARLLRNCCDVVPLSPVTDAEKVDIITGVLHEKEKLYGVSEVKLEPAVLKKLTGLSIDKAEAAIDRIVRLNRRKGETLTITSELLGDELKGFGGEVYGFGGINNESK